MKKKEKVITDEEKNLLFISQVLAGRALTVATLALVVVNIIFSLPYAPFIIMLMASRITSSLYLVIKHPCKKNIIWLIVWVALMAKSIQSYVVYLMLI